MTQPVQAVLATDHASAVRAVGLGRVIDGRAILQDLNFEIRTGEFLALLGANGAGKSTLLRILATLIPPTHGELTLFGQRAKAGAADLRNRLGLIGHGSMLYRDLSAMENLVFFATLYSVKEPQKRARDLLDWIGLSHRADDAVKTFSRGMTQRVAIARALVHEPAMLLADEPFAGLDAPSCDMLQQMLLNLHTQGRTIILANHNIDQCMDLSQRAIVLRHGRIVADEETSSTDSRSLLREVTGP